MDGSKKDEVSKSHTLPTHTREQIAKMSGVGTGTVARYDTVMKSDNEELKEKVKTGQVTVNKAYEEVRKQESRTCKIWRKAVLIRLSRVLQMEKPYPNVL